MSLFSSLRLPPRIASFGASGTCVQVALDLRYQAPDDIMFAGYISDRAPDADSVDGGYPVMSFDELREAGDIGVFVPVHDPAGRRAIFERLDVAGIPLVGARGLPHLAHPEAEVGEGGVVISTTRLGHNTRIGRGTLVFADVVGHDVVIGEFTTLAMSSVVAGHVTIGDNAFIGLGSVIHNGTSRRPLVIGDGAIIGAGAVVERDVGPGEIVVSPRAMPAREWGVLRSRLRATDT